MKIKVLSLFDGISVARQALTELGYEVEYYASEIDKYAISVATHNFPDTIEVGDVKLLKSEDFKGIDLIVGGSPCQDLSIAKQDREGLKGSRSGLFYEFARLVKEIKPKYFLLENVNSMPKEAREEITRVMGVEPIMINASLVSAQNRKRLFWTNILNVTQPEDRGILLKDILETNVGDLYRVKTKNPRVERNIRETENKSLTLSASNWKGAINNGTTLIRLGSFNSGGQGDRVYSPEGKSVALSANGGGRGAKTGLYAVALTKTRTEEGKKKRKEMRKLTGKDFGSWKPEDIEYIPRQDFKSNTITTGLAKEGFIQESSIIRKLTPIECERLQSLPDDYTKEPNISNTQRYKMLGNAFNKEVVKHILGFM